MAKELKDMSGTELRRTYEKEQAVGSKLNRRMIDEGRGHDRPSDIRGKTDPLSREMNEHFDRHGAIVSEMRQREQWHGSIERPRKSKVVRHRWM